MSLAIQSTQTQEQVTPTQTTQEQTQAVQNSQAPARPEGIPEKFWDAEKGTVNTDALLKSYTELESKLGKGEQQQEPENQQAQQPSQEQVQQAVGADAFKKYGDEIAEKGTLSEESYKELETKGFPRAMVDSYVEGEKLKATMGIEQVISSVGGRDAFSEMSQWAATNLSPTELEMYNAQVAPGATLQSASMALQWLKAKYEGAVGKEPTLVTGRPAGGSANAGFASKQEAMAAVRDKRYGVDAAYTRDVEQRLANRTYTL